MRLPSREPAQPSQKPGLRPRRENTMPAGMDAAMVAVIWIAIGSVLSDLSTASAWPISALITVWPAVTAFISARQQNRSQTLRFIELC